MGKNENQTPIPETQIEIPQSSCECCSTGLSSIRRIFNFRCFVVLILSAAVFLSALSWFPFMRSGFDAADRNKLFAAPIIASFRLQRSVSLIAEHASWLEYDIFDEIGIPNTKVSIISLHPSVAVDSTDVVFGFLPDPYDVPFASVALSVLKSSLIELVLLQSNLTLTHPLFGQPSSFEVLKFPGGITVIPSQFASIWQVPQILFNFTLNNSVAQIEENLDQLKDQLKFGLQLRSYENIYVQLTNLNGSTVAPPVIVQASVISDRPGHNLLPQRLKQLAEAITGSPMKNLGLDHAVFGKVKQIQLSTYLEQSLGSPQGSPSPSPAPSEGNHYSAPPQSHYPAASPSYAPAPSVGHRNRSPCSTCFSSSPYERLSPPAPAPKNGLQDPAPPSLETPKPPVVSIGYPPKHSPCHGPTFSPRPSPVSPSDPPAPSGLSRHSAIPPRGQHLGDTRNLDPHVSPSAAGYSPSPLPEKSGAVVYSMPASSPISPYPSSYARGPLYKRLWLVGSLGFLMYSFLCAPY